MVFTPADIARVKGRLGGAREFSATFESKANFLPRERFIIDGWLLRLTLSLGTS